MEQNFGELVVVLPDAGQNCVGEEPVCLMSHMPCTAEQLAAQ